MTYYVFYGDQLILESELLPSVINLPLGSYVYATVWTNPWGKSVYNQTYQQEILIGVDRDDVPPQYRAMALLLT
jgi:hypothetical protein